MDLLLEAAGTIRVPGVTGWSYSAKRYLPLLW
jgi:hypothetical protein